MVKHSEALNYWIMVFNPTSVIPQKLTTMTGKGREVTYMADTRQNHHVGPTLPYSEILDQAARFKTSPFYTNPMDSIISLYFYFKRLKQSKTVTIEEYRLARIKWLCLAPFFPSSRVTPTYRSLHEYFTQSLNYTPLSFITVKRMFT